MSSWPHIWACLSCLCGNRDPVMERRLQAADQMLALRQAMADDSEGRRLSVDMKVAITGHVRRRHAGGQAGRRGPGPPRLGDSRVHLQRVVWVVPCMADRDAVRSPCRPRLRLAHVREQAGRTSRGPPCVWLTAGWLLLVCGWCGVVSMGVVEEGPLFPAAAVSRVREVVQELFRELNGVFLYYCGLPRLGDPLYGLTLAELSHLLHRARVCHVTRDKDAVTKVPVTASSSSQLQAR